jgi:hypothetical protein
MEISSLCPGARTLGHSGPTLHWWLSLTAADQGAWISGLGAFAAALTAVWIAGRERRIRNREKRDLTMVATAFVYMDIQQIAVFGCHLHGFVLKLSKVENGKPTIAEITNIKLCIERVRLMCDRTSLKRINALPTSVSIALCRAVGGLPFACDAIESTVTTIEFMTRKLDDVRADLKVHALTLGIPLRGLIEYFKWFGCAFPEDKKEAADATIQVINDTVAGTP